MSRLHRPGALVAIDVTASRQPLELVNPGWTRYDTLTYAPGVRAGRTLFMSGFAALDMETQEALLPGRPRRAGRGDVRRDPASCSTHAGLAAADLARDGRVLRRARAAGDYKAVAEVRERLLAPPWPASTGACAADLLRPEFLLEVFPTALFPEEQA